MDREQHERTMKALNIVAKWRTFFAGWQLGTRAKGDPESDAIRDHREVTILLRVENSALIALMIEKGIFTIDDWTRQLEIEAKALSDNYAQTFPGVTANEDGLVMNPAIIQEYGTMEGWLP